MASPLRLTVCRRGDAGSVARLGGRRRLGRGPRRVRGRRGRAVALPDDERPDPPEPGRRIGAAGRRPAAARARPGRGGPGPPRHRRPLRSARAPRPRPPRLRGRPARVASGRRRARTGPPAPGSWIGPSAAGCATSRADRPRRDRQGPRRCAGRRRSSTDAASTRYLLEAGGDLVARGPGPDGDPWLVGIEDPAGGPEPLAAIAVEDGAVATSSVRLRSWVHDGRTVHHLLDPRTGEPAEAGLRAVTVVGPDPAWAEVWSKTLFIGGGARSRGEARRAWPRRLVGDRRRETLEMTAAARARTAWVEGED